MLQYYFFDCCYVYVTILQHDNDELSVLQVVVDTLSPCDKDVLIAALKEGVLRDEWHVGGGAPDEDT